jgi:hypothetical protein
MVRAQLAQSDSANLSRRIHPHYQLGDTVYVSTKNWTTTRPTKKLDYKFAGPYKIVKVIRNPETGNELTYKLDLPKDLGVRNRENAFYCSLLQPAVIEDGPVASQIIQPPPPIKILRKGDDEAEKEYEVEKILDSRMRNKQVKYLVHWKGHDQETWEPLRHLAGAPEALADFLNTNASLRAKRTEKRAKTHTHKDDPLL